MLELTIDDKNKNFGETLTNIIKFLEDRDGVKIGTIFKGDGF